MAKSPPDDTFDSQPPPGLEATADGGISAVRPPAADARRSSSSSEAVPDLGPKLGAVRPLGHGAMGVVWEVQHRGLEKRMAVKLMNREAITAHDFERFRREARAASDIDHPNILRIHDLDRTAEGTPYILMELLDGHDLRVELEQRGRLPLERVVGMLRGVAEALDRAHALGIVHRDLKPANLFLTQSGTVKVLDFGICHYGMENVARLTQKGAAVGTPRYMAPEQFRGSPVSAQTDVHALAAIAYELLTGRPPFGDASLFDLAARGPLVRPPRVETLVPGLPPAVGETLARGLAYSPADRFESAGALVAALDAALSGVRPSAGGATPAARRTRAAVWAGLGLAAAAALAVALFLLLRPAPALRPPAEAESPPASGVTAPGPGGTPGAAAIPAATAPAAAGPVWPREVRLLVAPFESAPERPTDEVLWPLVDRMIGNALEPDERVRGRLRRADPARVFKEIERRELGTALEHDELLELAAVFDANVVLSGALARTRGKLQLRATLWTVDERGSQLLEVEDVQLPRAAGALAEAVRAVLWPEPRPIPAERLARLLVTRPEAAEALSTLGPATSEDERRDVLERITALDPAAVVVPWLLYLDQPVEFREAGLGKAAPGVADPELRRLFEAIADRENRTSACAGLDAAALGERYPETIGPLAAAVCARHRGDSAQAVRQARQAFDRAPLRGLARPFLSQVLLESGSCAELLPLHLEFQQLLPEDPAWWGTLAHAQVRCGDPDGARRSLAVARALLGEAPREQRRVAYIAAAAQLAQLDVEGAREWIDVLERASQAADRRSKYYAVTSLPFFLQGRFGEGLETLREGLTTLAGRPDSSYPLLVASYVWMCVHLGDLDEAERAAAEFGPVFRDGADPGGRYAAQMLDLALEHARERVDRRTLEVRMEDLGEAVDAALAGAGRLKRHAEECLLLSHLDPVDAPAQLDRADAVRSVQGGCRLRRAEQLLADGEHAAAAAEFRQALADILAGSFLYTDFIPAALFGLARAQEALGQNAEARANYERLVTNYAHADRNVPEAAAAAAALARLP